MPERLLRPREACEALGVSYPTLYRWVKQGKVRAVRTLGGKFRVPEGEVRRLLAGVEAGETRAIIYARVSSPDQRGDLERQIQYLTQYCAAKGYRVVDVLSDVASGLNANRRGLLKVFDHVANRRADVIVVTYRDRLAGFGFEYLEHFFGQFGARVEAIHGDVQRDSRQELVGDMVELIASFAGRLYGMRSHRKTELVEGFRRLLEEVGRNE